MTGLPEEEQFPAAVYRETVLAPLFEGVKRHHWRQQMRINRASAIMLGPSSTGPGPGSMATGRGSRESTGGWPSVRAPSPRRDHLAERARLLIRR
jgi:hypothetical protein